MIVFDLRCGQAHVFEAWFASTPAYEDQRARRLIACPLCDDTDIGKAVMAPAIPLKANRGGEPGPAALLAAQREMEARAVYVGRDFAARARALHRGDPAEPADTGDAGSASSAGDDAVVGIYGEASLADARALIDDGIPVLPLPFRPKARFDA